MYLRSLICVQRFPKTNQLTFAKTSLIQIIVFYAQKKRKKIKINNKKRKTHRTKELFVFTYTKRKFEKTKLYIN